MGKHRGSQTTNCRPHSLSGGGVGADGGGVSAYELGAAFLIIWVHLRKIK